MVAGPGLHIAAPAQASVDDVGTRDESRRSILIVAPSWPHPPTWGFATRVYQLAKHLAKRHRVSLLTFDGGDRSTANGEAAAIFESVDFVSRPERIRNKRRAQLESLMSLRSHHLGSLRSNEMQTALAALLSRRSFDVVQLESSQMGFVLPVPGIPVLVDEHNIEFLLLRRLAGVESSAVRRAFGYLEATKARREELQVWAGCHGVVVTSETDLAVVHSNEPRKPACVVPNGVDIDYFRPAAADPEAATVVFSGAINYRPNTDAVAYFIRDVMPHLKRYNPSARFVVVGQGAPEWLVRMADASVEFTGWVADVRPHLQRAAVVVAPLRAGSGTRLKILEALAMGKPVVTTSIGCEGLSVIDGEHLKVADDPDAFAEATARLISDRAAAREVGRSGRRLVEREYSWDVIATRMERFHSQLIRKEIRN